MLAQAVRRLVVAIPTLMAIITATFVLMHLAPGGPFARERQMPPEIERRLQAEYGLDLPIAEQLGRYLFGTREHGGGLIRGDLGPSMAYKDKDVLDIIVEGAPTSAILGLGAMAFALFVGGFLGVMAALRQNQAQDYIVMAIAIAGVCLPPLVVGPLLQLTLGVEWGLFPTQGLHRDEFGVRYLVLPILTLALPLTAIISRLMRASMIEAMRSNPIRTARAKGLPEMRVVLKHALPIALLPIVSLCGTGPRRRDGGLVRGRDHLRAARHRQAIRARRAAARLHARDGRRAGLLGADHHPESRRGPFVSPA